jgi:uncharacterized OB-fold protein
MTHGQGCGRGGSSSGESSNKSTSDECRCCGKMGYWARECRSKCKKEQAHVVQDKEEGSLRLMTTTLTSSKVSSMLGSAVEASSSGAEIELKKENVYTHLDEEKSVMPGQGSYTEATNHMSRCRTAFT